MENISSALILVLILVVIVFYRYLTRYHNHFKDKGIPNARPSLVFGNYYNLLVAKKGIGEVYKDVYDRFPDDPLVGVFQFRSPNLMVKGLDDIKRVLVSDFNHFATRVPFTNTTAEPMSDHLFNVEADLWRPMRQKLTPTFTSNKLKNMFNLIVEVSDEFNRYIHAVAEDGDELEFRELMSKFTTDVIGSCAFGIKMNSMLDTNNPFRKIGNEIVEPTPKKALKGIVRTYSIELFKFFGLRMFDESVETFLRSVVKEIVAEREKNGNDRNDFIDLLLELKQNDKISGNDQHNIKVDDKFILSQVFIFFIAGFETSSTLMSFVLHELALHPEIQEKVFNEIQSVLSANDGKITYETIKEMQFMEMVICETQRKYPALGVLPRICTSRYTFPGTKFTIEKGEYLTIPLYAIHHDPRYYPEPDKFIPERFTPEAKSKRHPMTFMPFGEGPRNCIATRFGKIESKVGLIALLKDYYVEPSEKTREKIVINPLSFVSASKHGIWLRLKKRV